MCIFGREDKGPESVRIFRLLGFCRTGCGCCHGQGGSSAIWVGCTIGQGSYRHPSAMLSHCWSLWYLVFTILASAESWESYLGSQCAQWLCGNGTQRRPCEQADVLSYPTGTTAEACALYYKGGVSDMPLHGARTLCSWFTGCSSFGEPAGRIFSGTVTTGSLLSTRARFSHPVSKQAQRFKHHLIHVSVLGEDIGGRYSPSKHNAPAALFVGFPAHLLGHSPEIFGKEA